MYGADEVGRIKQGLVRLGSIAMIALLLGCPGRAPAQAPEPGEEVRWPQGAGTLKIRSEPPGATVTLLGEHLWRGTTPWDLNRNLEGRYTIVARLAGYERWERTVLLIAGETRQIEIRLEPKRAWKAGLRSLLFPGWGQFYRGRPGKGSLFLLGTAASTAGLWWTHEGYQDRVDDYTAAHDLYFSADNIEELDELRAAMDRAQRRADRAYDRRQVLLYVAGGFYLASFLDALFLSSGRSPGDFAVLSPWGRSGPALTLLEPADGTFRLALRWNRSQGVER